MLCKLVIFAVIRPLDIFQSFWNVLTHQIPRMYRMWMSITEKLGRKHARWHLSLSPGGGESNRAQPNQPAASPEVRPETTRLDVPLFKNVSEEYQTKEIARDTGVTEESSDESHSRDHTTELLQEIPRNQKQMTLCHGLCPTKPETRKY